MPPVSTAPWLLECSSSASSCFCPYLPLPLLQPLRSECQRTLKFVPGSWLAGEGRGCDSLQRSGIPSGHTAFPAARGTCTPPPQCLQKDVLQRLPWQSQTGVPTERAASAGWSS